MQSHFYSWFAARCNHSYVNIDVYFAFVFHCCLGLRTPFYEKRASFQVGIRIIVDFLFAKSIEISWFLAIFKFDSFNLHAHSFLMLFSSDIKRVRYIQSVDFKGIILQTSEFYFKMTKVVFRYDSSTFCRHHRILYNLIRHIKSLTDILGVFACLIILVPFSMHNFFLGLDTNLIECVPLANTTSLCGLERAVVAGILI